MTWVSLLGRAISVKSSVGILTLQSHTSKVSQHSVIDWETDITSRAPCDAKRYEVHSPLLGKVNFSPFDCMFCDIDLRKMLEEIYVGKSQWGFTVSVGGLLRFPRCGGIRLLPLSPVSSQFQHFFATGQGSRVASCSTIFPKVQSGIAPFSVQLVPKCPLSLLHVCQPGCQGAKSRPEFGPLRTGTSGIPRPAHHGPIFFLRPPACTLLHSPHNVKPPPTPTGLEDKYFPGKRHKWRGLGHCKVAHFPFHLKPFHTNTM